VSEVNVEFTDPTWLFSWGTKKSGVIFIMIPLFLLQIVQIFLKHGLSANVWCDILIIVIIYTSFYTTIQRCKVKCGSE
jgi:hypothetical protein